MSVWRRCCGFAVLRSFGRLIRIWQKITLFSGFVVFCASRGIIIYRRYFSDAVMIVFAELLVLIC